MDLTRADIARFKQDGFCTVEGFFDQREINGMRVELARLQRDGKLRNVATDGDGRTHSQSQVNLQICPISSRSPFYRALKWHPRVISGVQQLIGDPVVFRLDQIFLKPAHHGAGTKWHQDNAYWNQPHPELGTGMWVAIHDANVANGCMNVVPRSYERLERHERDLGSDHHIYAPVVPEDRAVAIELKAGGVLFFNWGTLHCTRANTTSAARAGLALHFMNGDAVNEAFWDYETNVRLTGPQSTGGLAEEGVAGRGTWASELEAALRMAEHQPA